MAGYVCPICLKDVTPASGSVQSDGQGAWYHKVCLGLASLSPGDEQLIALSLAALGVRRAGWEPLCREVAGKLGGSVGVFYPVLRESCLRSGDVPLEEDVNWEG